MVKVTVEEERNPVRPYSVYKVPDFHQGAGFIRRRAPDKHCTLHPYNKKSIKSRDAFSKAAALYNSYTDEQKKGWEKIEVTAFAYPRTSKSDHIVTGFQAFFSTYQKLKYYKNIIIGDPLTFSLVIVDYYGSPVVGDLLYIVSMKLDLTIYSEITNGVGKPTDSSLIKMFELYRVQFVHGVDVSIIPTLDPTVARDGGFVYYWSAEEFSKIEKIIINFLP